MALFPEITNLAQLQIPNTAINQSQPVQSNPPRMYNRPYPTCPFQRNLVLQTAHLHQQQSPYLLMIKHADTFKTSPVYPINKEYFMPRHVAFLRKTYIYYGQ